MERKRLHTVASTSGRPRLLPGLLGLALFCTGWPFGPNVAQAELRRIELETRTLDHVSVNAGDAYRWGIAVPWHDRTFGTLIGPLPRGTVRTWLSPQGLRGNGRLTATLRGVDVRARMGGTLAVTCSHDLDEATAEAAWLPCEFKIPRSCSSCRLEVTLKDARAETIHIGDLQVETDGYEPENPVPVFVLLLDTLRYDTTQPFGALPITPHIEALAKDAVVFTDARSVSSWTRPAVGSLLSGVSDRRHGARDRLDVLSTRVPSMPKRLQAAGYETSAWSTNANILPIWGFAQGFDLFTDAGSLRWASDKTDAARVVDAALASVRGARSKKVFSYLHFMDPHEPYNPAPADLEVVRALELADSSFPARKDHRSEDGRNAYESYLAEIRGMDREIGRFIAELQDLGWYDDAIIVLVADHGEEFWDHGGTAHGKTLYDEVIRVPLMIKFPSGVGGSGRIDDPAGLADIAPTILSFLGSDTSGMDGYVLRLPKADTGGDSDTAAAAASRPQLSELILDGRRQSAIVADHDKLLVYHSFGRQELFELATDPHEQNDAIARRLDKALHLRKLLDTIASQHEDGWHVRACGSAEPTKAQWRLRGSRMAVERRLLEEEDSVKQSRNEMTASLGLTPQTREREFLGTMIKIQVSDSDEFSIHLSPADGTQAELVLDQATVEVYLGRSREPESQASIDLIAATKRASVTASTDVGCGVGGAGLSVRNGRPMAPPKEHLRVWYVQEAEGVAGDELDPAVADRLRALGYMQ